MTGFDTPTERLDHAVRKTALIGTLLLSWALLIVGVCTIYRFMSAWTCSPSSEVTQGVVRSIACPTFNGDHWHMVVSILIALFTIPTILILSIFRAVAKAPPDRPADPAHLAIAEKLIDAGTGIVDWLSRIGKK